MLNISTEGQNVKAGAGRFKICSQMPQIAFIWNIRLTSKGDMVQYLQNKTTPPSVSGKELGYENADPETAKNLRLYLGFHGRARLSPSVREIGEYVGLKSPSLSTST